MLFTLLLFVIVGVVEVQELPSGSADQDSEMGGEYVVRFAGCCCSRWLHMLCLGGGVPQHTYGSVRCLVVQWEVHDFSKLAEKHYSPKFEIGTHLW